MGEFFDFVSATSVKKKKTNLSTCPVCGCTSQQFLATGFLGCSQCYDNLSQVVEPVIQRMFGLNEHTSHYAKNFAEQKPKNQLQTVFDLKQKLKNAVASENYEYASVLKKQIDELGGGE